MVVSTPRGQKLVTMIGSQRVQDFTFFQRILACLVLGTGLVLRPLKCNEVWRETIRHLLLHIITHYIWMMKIGSAPLLRIWFRAREFVPMPYSYSKTVTNKWYKDWVKQLMWLWTVTRFPSEISFHMTKKSVFTALSRKCHKSGSMFSSSQPVVALQWPAANCCRVSTE